MAAASVPCHRTVSAACESGCFVCLQRLLAAGEPVDGQNSDGWRPLHVVAHRNHVACLKLLLQHGRSDLDWAAFEGHTPLVLAVTEGHYDVCRILLEYGASANTRDVYQQPALLYAIRKFRRNDLVKLLCEYGADTNAADYNSDYMLNSAAEISGLDRCDVIQTLLEYGADVRNVTSTGVNVLMSALLARNIKIFDHVFEHAKQKCTSEEFHALINQSSNYKKLYADGITPLAQAARLSITAEPMKKLLAHGADPMANSCDAIFCSVYGHIDCLRLLLPPVTTLDDLELACIVAGDRSVLVKAAESDSDTLRLDYSRPGDRLKCLLDSGLHSVINHRIWLRHFRSPLLMNFGGLANTPRTITQMFGNYATPLTLMIINQTFEENIKIMLEYGANWWGNQSTQSGSIPPHFYLNQEWEVWQLARKFDCNIFHPYYSFNLTILPVLFTPTVLDAYLRSGLDCRSCFHPEYLIDFVSRDAWTFEKMLRWIRDNRNREVINDIGIVVNMAALITDDQFIKAFDILLKYLPNTGNVLWMAELIDNDEKCSQLVTKLSQVSKLQHLCRCMIRDRVRSLVRNYSGMEKAMTQLGLPTGLVKYLMYVD